MINQYFLLKQDFGFRLNIVKLFLLFFSSREAGGRFTQLSQHCHRILNQQVTGLGKAALRTARGAGLSVRYVGGRGWILGRDWIDYVIEHGHAANDN